MKIKVIEGEPWKILSRGFCRADLGDCEALVIVRDRGALDIVGDALLDYWTAARPVPDVEDVTK